MPPQTPASGSESYEFKWYDPGPENPFGLRVLDCRSFTQTVTAFTLDEAVGRRFFLLRASDGRDLIEAPIKDAVRVPVSLRFPHNGEPLAVGGSIFKAGSMEVKWDIYIHNSKFLFARSWSGQLCYRASAVVGHEDIHITDIECGAIDSELAASHVYFLIGTHAMSRVLPHRIPRSVPEEPMTIAQVSFTLFGKLGCYATYDDITEIPIPRPQSG